jgi:hypothetical protein
MTEKASISEVDMEWKCDKQEDCKHGITLIMLRKMSETNQ